VSSDHDAWEAGLNRRLRSGDQQAEKKDGSSDLRRNGVLWVVRPPLMEMPRKMAAIYPRKQDRGKN